jgi:hypothetical protein
LAAGIAGSFAQLFGRTAPRFYRRPGTLTRTHRRTPSGASPSRELDFGVTILLLSIPARQQRRDRRVRLRRVDPDAVGELLR